MLTEDEICAVVLACASAPGGATEEDMKAAVQWAQQVRIDAALLNLVLEGRVAIDMRDGEPAFTAREMTLTDRDLPHPTDRSESDGE